MSVLDGNRKAGEEPHDSFEGPRHPCFLCGRGVGEGKVIHWMGSLHSMRGEAKGELF